MNMLHATLEKVKSQMGAGSRERFAGIVEFAEQIGRDRTHVWRVLKSQRRSGKLAAAWARFQEDRKSKA